MALFMVVSSIHEYINMQAERMGGGVERKEEAVAVQCLQVGLTTGSSAPKCKQAERQTPHRNRQRGRHHTVT